MRCIALDVGDKKVGVAIQIEKLAFPKDIVPRIKVIDYLKKILSQNPDITHIIVGLPYDLYDRDTKQLEKTQKFIQKLWIIFSEKTIIWHDERFTTIEARFENNAKNIDDISASLILESFLNL